MFSGPGDARALCRALDWSATPLGAVAEWPRSLRTIAEAVLGDAFPMILLWGPELIQIYNNAYVPFLGDKHPWALGIPTRVCWPEAWDFSGPVFDRVFGGETVSFEDQLYRLLRRGADQPPDDVYITLSYSPVLDDTGAVGGVLVTLLDTTDSVRAKRLEKEREQLVADLTIERERLRSVILNMPAPVALHMGPELRFELANEAYHQISGHRDLIGLSPREAFPEIEGQGVYEIMQNSYDTGEAWLGTETYVHYDRNGKGMADSWWNLHFVPIRDTAGQVAGLINFSIDVTDQVLARRHVERGLVESEQARAALEQANVALAEQQREREIAGRRNQADTSKLAAQARELQAATAQLRERTEEAEEGRARLARVLEGIGDAFVAIDRDWNYVYVNSKAADMLRRRAEDLIGKHVWTEFPKAATGPTHEAHLRVMREQKAEQLEQYIESWNRWYDIRIYPSPDGLLTFFQDITERKNGETALDASISREHKLQELTEGLAAALTPTDVAAVAVRAGMAAANADQGGFTCLSEDQRQFEVLVTLGSTREQDTAWHHFPNTRDVPAGYVADSREPLYVTSQSEYIDRFPQLESTVRTHGIAAEVALPLIAGERETGKVVGTLHLDWNAPREFSIEERTFFETIARQCAQALDRAERYSAERSARAEAERAVARTTRLQQVTAALAAAVTTEDVVNVMLNDGLMSVGAHAGIVCQLNGDATEIDHLWALGYPIRDFTWFKEHALSAALPPRDVVRTREPIFLETAQEWEELYVEPGLGAGLPRAVAVLPLLVGDALIGVMALRFAEARRFTAADRTQIMSVASQCAQALERARLLTAEQAARAEAERERVIADEARKVAEAANESKSRFLANMSHELRQPLNAITGYADLVAMGVRGPVTKKQHEDLERIKASSKHLTSLIGDILEFAKIEAGQLAYNITTVSVAPALREVASFVAPQVKAKRLEFTLAACDETLMVRADRERFIQAVLNLFTNAVKYTPADGTITVSCAVGSELGGTVEIRIADTGIGIPAAKLPTIFDPFVQAHRALNRPAEGTGLGLAIARDIARFMGGDLTVESEEHVGSIFTLSLPKA